MRAQGLARRAGVIASQTSSTLQAWILLTIAISRGIAMRRGSFGWKPDTRRLVRKAGCRASACGYEPFVDLEDWLRISEVANVPDDFRRMFALERRLQALRAFKMYDPDRKVRWCRAIRCGLTKKC